MNTLAFLQNIGPVELIALAFLGLLIFGKRLPEVGKSLGQSIVRFKEGLRGVEDDIERASIEPSKPANDNAAPAAIETKAPAATANIEPSAAAPKESEAAKAPSRELVASATSSDGKI